MNVFHLYSKTSVAHLMKNVPRVITKVHTAYGFLVFTCAISWNSARMFAFYRKRKRERERKVEDRVLKMLKRSKQMLKCSTKSKMPTSIFFSFMFLSHNNSEFTFVSHSSNSEDSRDGTEVTISILKRSFSVVSMENLIAKRDHSSITTV